MATYEDWAHCDKHFLQQHTGNDYVIQELISWFAMDVANDGYFPLQTKAQHRIGEVCMIILNIN